MKKLNNNGFTIIEMIIVVIILGFGLVHLYSFVTNRVVESRKNELVNNVNNYINHFKKKEINKYSLDIPNVIYFIPIDCIGISNGNDPFGDWFSTYENGYGYVLVEYDEVSDSYMYGFTFLDNSNNGMYPLIKDNISIDDIRVDLELRRKIPESGSKAYDYVSSKIWDESGFRVDSNTSMVIYNRGDKAPVCEIIIK